MLSHPLPIGTRVKLVHKSKYDWYKVLRVRPWDRAGDIGDEWYYTLVAEEFWQSEGLDSEDRFHGAAQTESAVIITAEAIYDALRAEDP